MNAITALPEMSNTAPNQQTVCHEDGSFQEYCLLDAKYLAVLPDDVDPSIQGPRALRRSDSLQSCPECQY